MFNLSRSCASEFAIRALDHPMSWVLKFEIDHRLPLKEARAQFEFSYLSYKIENFDGNIAKAAKSIGIDRCSLHRKIRDLGIQYRNRRNK